MGIYIKNWSLADWKELLEWAQIGANNAMIGEFTKVEEVPRHGRLIDADAVLRRYDYELSRTYTDDFAKGFQLGVKAAVGNGTAVVIEAEEGET